MPDDFKPNAEIEFDFTNKAIEIRSFGNYGLYYLNGKIYKITGYAEDSGTGMFEMKFEEIK